MFIFLYDVLCCWGEESLVGDKLILPPLFSLTKTSVDSDTEEESILFGKLFCYFSDLVQIRGFPD